MHVGHRERKNGYYQSVWNDETKHMGKKVKSLKVKKKMIDAIVISMSLYDAPAWMLLKRVAE